MARAVFGGGLSPYITKAQDRPTPYNPLGALSTAIRQPFVEDVLVPGISRIRDEMRISEQEEQIADKAAAARAQGAQLMQQAAAAEQQGLDAEIAAAVSGVDVPLMDDIALRDLAMTPARRVAEERAREGTIAGRDLAEAAADAAGIALGPDHHLRSSTMRAATMLERELAAIKRGPSAAGARKQGDPDKAKRIAKRLREMGLGDVVAEIAQGVSAEEALNAAAARTQQTQQRRGEQEATTAATQRFERALAGELPQVAAEQGAQPIVIDGEVVLPPNWEDLPISHPQRAAYRRFEDTGELPAPPAQAAQPQAIQRPESIERANRLRQQATDMEREAAGIEGTPVYRTFGDHAMAFLDALDSGDVATQMALMESVGGSTDYQPFGKGAVGKAIGKDASMRARKDLLDLKKKYLDAKRREDSAMKLVERKAELRGKKTKTGGRSGGYGKKNDLLLDALVTLNRGDNLTDKQKSQLRRAGGLSESEVSSLTPDRATAWRALTRRVKGKRAESEARDIMRGQATPEEQERAEVRRLEREARDLRAEAKATTDAAEKARLEARADAKTAAAADAEKAAATRREQRADEKRELDRIAALQKSLDAVEITIAGESNANELEKLQKQKEALEAKIAELTGNIPAKAD